MRLPRIGRRGKKGRGGGKVLAAMKRRIGAGKAKTGNAVSPAGINQGQLPPPPPPRYGESKVGLTGFAKKRGLRGGSMGFAKKRRLYDWNRG